MIIFKNLEENSSRERRVNYKKLKCILMIEIGTISRPKKISPRKELKSTLCISLHG